MLSYLKVLSLKRSGWLLLTLSVVGLEATALYFQHGMGLAPCVMCIYERLALFTIVMAGIIGMIAPKISLLRWLAISLGLFGAVKGLLLSIKHSDYQLNPAPWNQCSPFVEFPETLPLNLWFPHIFEASGDCGRITWKFLSLSMPQWLIIIFALYLVVLIIILFSQFKPTRSAKRSIFK